MSHYSEYKQYHTIDEGYRRIYARYILRAQKKNLHSDMSYKQALTLFKSRCHYCDEKPANPLKFDGKIIGRYQGIDRVDNTLGYVSGNIVPCCKYCNYFKGTRTELQFADHAKRLYTKLLEKIDIPF